ncbi:hypothetical protein J2W97_001221 [Paenibacillus jamilae]|nr:hypothetical protein [Paenibacillus jamilae]
MKDKEEMHNQIHDNYYDVYGTVPNDEQIAKIVDSIPDKIKALAMNWGWYDTEVRESVYVWMKQNKK